ncbi:hypothetical protein [Roseobacter litoralis]|uniref:hypothetical protein n=1 Tax=Roseobacter litoralis TaxID=42443 RepID=UPI002492F382|nr:hypothetical protein [Roseobacter litoralis]
MSRNTQNQRPRGNAPEDTLRDGSLKASIWRNDGENGPYYTTTLARTFTNAKGQVQDSHSFGAGDLLRVGELARSAYHRSNELRRDLGREQTPDQSRDTQDRGQDRDQGQRIGRDEDRSQRQQQFNDRRSDASGPDHDLSR